MIQPSYDEVMAIKDEYDVIPVYKEVYADSVTPITLLRKILQKSDKCFLLESIEGGVKWGRYSFIGCNPKARLVYKTEFSPLQARVRPQLKPPSHTKKFENI